MNFDLKSIDKKSVVIGAVAGFVLSAIVGNCSSSPSAQIQTGHWYDYGNGMINLDQVTHITPRVSDWPHGQFPISSNGLADCLRKIDENPEWYIAKAASGKGERSTMRAEIKFDDFMLSLQPHEIGSRGDVKDAFKDWMSTLEKIKQAAQ